jgi:hypothetical protein
MHDDAGEGAVCIVSAEYAKVCVPFNNGASNRHALFGEPSIQLAAECRVDARAESRTHYPRIAEPASFCGERMCNYQIFYEEPETVESA